MQAKLFEIVCDVLQVDISTVSLKTSMENTEKWDSLKQMQIVIAIEEEFDLKISDQDLIEANSIEKLILSINAIR
jgi:acyl carrier protein